MNDFLNKVVVITGAASGFGREFALAAAKRKMKIVLADVQLDALDETMKEVAALGVEVISVHCDVSSAEAVENLASQALAEFGTVHVLFNNAGVGTGGLVWENTIADWEWILGVNLWGVIHGVRAFTTLMLECAKKEKNYQGHIINTASVAGLINSPNLGAYNVTKHAVVALSETLFQDLKLVEAPISASVLCPFFVSTGISRSERNRPLSLRNTDELTASMKLSDATIEAAVRASKVTAAEVAEQTFTAIKEGRFYILTHLETLLEVRARMEDILEIRNPKDPFESTPTVRKLMQRRLMGHGRIK